MNAAQERATAHQSLRQLRAKIARDGGWSRGCTDLLMVALEFTKPRRPWWRFW